MNTPDLRLADHPAHAAANAADFTFEPLGAQARGEILAHLRQLSGADLALRFSATMTEAALARYTDSLDFNRDSFVAARASNGELTGIAQVMPIGSDRGAAAEVAFSLAPAARGKGWGSRLMREAITVARTRGITRLIAQVCPQNTPMLAILRGAGMSITREDCEMVGTMTITAAQI